MISFVRNLLDTPHAFRAYVRSILDLIRVTLLID